MIINLDYSSRIPIYEQIVNEIEKFVSLGVLKENEQIPSIRELASNLGINPNTVKKAYTILENKKVIISKSTKGSFITENITNVKKQTINTHFEEIKAIMLKLNKLGISNKEIMERINEKNN